MAQSPPAGWANLLEARPSQWNRMWVTGAVLLVGAHWVLEIVEHQWPEWVEPMQMIHEKVTWAVTVLVVTALVHWTWAGIRGCSAWSATVFCRFRRWMSARMRIGVTAVFGREAVAKLDKVQKHGDTAGFETARPSKEPPVNRTTKKTGTTAMDATSVPGSRNRKKANATRKRNPR
ncbi:hypothetical protein ACSNOI_45305 [Actinomadura kijaniata]|uniref:hypothetical protein n=1 Tax=Actinomadura kijaniata TaxID=46161 RepID=UPI003F1D96F1